MKKLLVIALTHFSIYTQAQTTPTLQVMQHRADSIALVIAQERAKLLKMDEVETQGYQRRHDSMQLLIANRCKEIEVYNRTHPTKKPAIKPAKKTTH